ncbi:hypothetical protein LCGC14_1877020, partial [marine sediment metagenome]
NNSKNFKHNKKPINFFYEIYDLNILSRKRLLKIKLKILIDL